MALSVVVAAAYWWVTRNAHVAFMIAGVCSILGITRRNGADTALDELRFDALAGLIITVLSTFVLRRP